MAVSMDTIVKLPLAKKVLILLVAVFVIVGLYGYLAYLPQREEIKGLTDRRDTLRKEVNELQAVANNLRKFQAEVAQLRAQLNNALTQLPNKKEIPELLKSISKLGKESNLEFLRFRPTAERPKQFYAEVPLELVFLGTYHDTGMFFDRVSKLSRIINVENFKMAPSEKSGDQTRLKAQAVATTFRFLEEGATGAKQKSKSKRKK
jgi:type IV pilus assembly protein PilO